jgi:hypothetical protein
MARLMYIKVPFRHHLPKNYPATYFWRSRSSRRKDIV